MLLTALLFLLGLMAAYYLSERLEIKIQYGVLLYFWHSAFVFAFHQYVVSHGGDAVDYFSRTIQASAGDLGSGVVLLVTKMMAGTLSFSMLDCNLVFGFLGYAGLMLWLKVFKTMVADDRDLMLAYWALMFMPSFSFWTGGIGKDVFLVFGIALITLNMIRRDLDHVSIVLALMLITLVRPHVGAVIGFIYVIALMWEESVPASYKIIVKLFAIGFLAANFDYLQKYVGYLDAVGDVTYEGGISGYLSYISQYNSNAGSIVDVNSMMFPEILFSYFFRPTIFEAQSGLEVTLAVENCFLMLLIIYLAVKSLGASLVGLELNRWGLLLSIAICISTAYAMISSNFGISARTKWMVVPLIFLLMRIKPIGYSKRPTINNVAA